MVAVTIRLLEQDVYDALKLQTAAIGRGWRASLPALVEGDQRPDLTLPSDDQDDSERSALPQSVVTFRAYRNGAVERLERESANLGPTSAA